MSGEQWMTKLSEVDFVPPPPPPVFSEVFILKGFKSCVLEVRIPKGLRTCFSEVQILKELVIGDA